MDIELPQKGEYGLEVFANDPHKDGDMFTHVSQYLCCYSDGNFGDVYGDPSQRVPVNKPVAKPSTIGESSSEIGTFKFSW